VSLHLFHFLPAALTSLVPSHLCPHLCRQQHPQTTRLPFQSVAMDSPRIFVKLSPASRLSEEAMDLVCSFAREDEDDRSA
jgi:hypothetical protein